MSQRVDLDAARAARREAGGEAPVIVIDGEEFILPVELPFAIMDDLARLFKAKDDKEALAELSVEALPVITRGLLGSDYERFIAHRPSVDDFLVLFEGVMGAYGLSDDVGESSASA